MLSNEILVIINLFMIYIHKTKLSLTTIAGSTILLSFFAVFAVLAQDSLDLNGLWKSSYSGKVTEVRHTGNTILSVDHFSGTLDGNEFRGEIFLTANKCPNLEHFAPARGVMSDENTIVFTTDNAFHFDTNKCVVTEYFTDSVTYTRVQEEAKPLPASTPKGGWGSMSEDAWKNYLELVLEVNKRQQAEEKYRHAEDALNMELGVSPNTRPTSGPDQARDYFAPDPNYDGSDHEIIFDTPSPAGDMPMIARRGGNLPLSTGQQIGRIADFDGRVTFEFPLPNGTVERVQVRRVGTSIRPTVILPNVKVYLGDGASIDFVTPRSGIYRYETRTGAGVQKTMLEPPEEAPSYILPAPVRDLIHRAIDYFRSPDPEFDVPYGIAGVKG